MISRDPQIANGTKGFAGAAAGTLTGATLASGVTGSSLTSVGTLGSLAVTGNVVFHLATAVEVASYTLVLANDGQIVEMNVGTANNLTVPLNSSVAFPIGTQITIIQTGAGQTTIVPTGGVTINSEGAKLKLKAQWAAATLIKRATDTWVVVGNLSA